MRYWLRSFLSDCAVRIRTFIKVHTEVPQAILCYSGMNGQEWSKKLVKTSLRLKGATKLPEIVHDFVATVKIVRSIKICVAALKSSV